MEGQTTSIIIQNTKEKDYQTGTDDYNKLIAGGLLLLIGAGLVILYLKKRAIEA